MTPRGTPGLSLATDSTRASMITSMSARICLIRCSSGCVRIAFIGLTFLDLRTVRWSSFGFSACHQLLPRARGLVLRAADCLFALRFMRNNIDLQIVRQDPEPHLLFTRPCPRRYDTGNPVDGGCGGQINQASACLIDRRGNGPNRYRLAVKKSGQPAGTVSRRRVPLHWVGGLDVTLGSAPVGDALAVADLTGRSLSLRPIPEIIRQPLRVGRRCRLSITFGKVVVVLLRKSPGAARIDLG
jgi:hypothetical protein